MSGLFRVVVVLAVLLMLACAGGPPPEDMLRVEGTTFRMGTDAEELEAIQIATGLSTDRPLVPEMPSHEVTVEGFYLDLRDVSHSDFAEFVEVRPEWSRERADTARHNGRYLESWTDDVPPEGLLDHPVTFVTWYAAEAYCRWRGKRLPTEAEWEWASQDAEQRIEYPWGDAPPSDKLVNWSGSGIGTTAPVGSYPANRRGLYDMSGNVWHYLADPWLGSYDDMLSGQSSPDPEDRRVVRGGSYGASAVNLRVRHRDSHRASNAREMIGSSVPGLPDVRSGLGTGAP